MFAKNLLFVSALLSPLSGIAELSIISDEDMSEVVGQAFVTLEKNPCGTSSLACTKVNFGLKIETQLNIKKLELGKYDRSGEADVNPEKISDQFSDLDIDNFSLGSIDNAGNINPAVIENPYIELAFKNDTTPSTRELVGVRFGFESIDGEMTSTINTLSGEVDITVWHIFGEIRANLVHKIRSTQSEGLGSKFDLSAFEELPLNNAQGVFISLQKEAMKYTDGPDTTPGFFMNMPTPIRIGLLDVLTGLPRGWNNYRTCHSTPVGASNGDASYVGCY